MPLRSDLHPCRLPGFNTHNQHKVNEGKHVAQVSVIGLEVGHLAGAHGVLENPWRSFIWQQLARVQFEDVVLDFCQFGE